MEHNLGKHGHQSASQSEDDIAAATHGVFDHRAEGSPKKFMFPMMCDQLACMNIAVKTVIQ